MNEYIEYALSVVDSPTISTVRTISEADFSKYSSYSSKLRKLHLDENLFRIVEMNYAEIKATSDYTLSQYESGSFEMDEVFLNMNRLILNFLASVRTFLDHTETRLKREYGENSDELNFFKSETAEAYDNNFCYRFLYKLRNYSQHCGLPAGSVSINSTGDKNNKTVNTLNLLLVKDALLNNYESWGNPVKGELQNQQDNFDIMHLIDEKFLILAKVNVQVNSKIYVHFQNEANELLKLIIEAQSIRGVPCLTKNEDTGHGKADISITWFQFEAISRVTGIKINHIKE